MLGLCQVSNTFCCAVCVSLQDNIAERTCCGVHCKCSGQEGDRGLPGPIGQKVGHFIWGVAPPLRGPVCQCPLRR